MACSDSQQKLYVRADVITCSICFDHYTNPKTLPCGHSLCLSPCLERLSRLPPMLCPLCREEIEMPVSGRIEDLPTNYVLKHLLETAEPAEKKWADESERADEADAVSWISTSSGTNVCNDHDREDCQFFCGTCTMVVCAKCLLSTHKVGHHEIVAAAEFAREKIDSLLGTLGKVQAMDLGSYKDQGFSMRILQRMGNYYAKMPIFKETLTSVSSKRAELESLCRTLVDDLCGDDFERVSEVKRIPGLYAKLNKEYLMLDNLHNDICTDLRRLKKVGMFAAAAAVGFSLGLPTFLPI